jgi:hypothetical protein
MSTTAHGLANYARGARYVPSVSTSPCAIPASTGCGEAPTTASAGRCGGVGPTAMEDELDDAQTRPPRGSDRAARVRPAACIEVSP